MTIRELIVTIGVIGLIIERIIRWIFRFIRPEKEIDKIAMDMVKLNYKKQWDSTPLAFFYLYKKGLKNLRPTERFVSYLTDSEEEINKKLEEAEWVTNESFAIMVELGSLLSDLERQEKLPPELKNFLSKARSLTAKHERAIEYREPKIKEIVTKIFGKLKRQKT